MNGLKSQNSHSGALPRLSPKRALKTNAPTSQFENAVGSTGWWDLRRQRDQAKAWIRNTPAKRSLESDDEDDPEAEGD